MMSTLFLLLSAPIRFIIFSIIFTQIIAMIFSQCVVHLQPHSEICLIIQPGGIPYGSHPAFFSHPPGPGLGQ